MDKILEREGFATTDLVVTLAMLCPVFFGTFILFWGYCKKTTSEAINACNHEIRQNFQKIGIEFDAYEKAFHLTRKKTFKLFLIIGIYSAGFSVMTTYIVGKQMNWTVQNYITIQSVSAVAHVYNNVFPFGLFNFLLIHYYLKIFDEAFKTFKENLNFVVQTSSKELNLVLR